MCERAGDPQQALASAIDALAAVDTILLSDDDLHDQVMALQHEMSRLAAIRARFVASWDGRRLWADDGSKSATARLSRECDAAPMTARVELKRARKLRSMPATAVALAEGKLSVDKADLLAQVNQPEVAHLFARDEQFLVEQVKTLRFPDAVAAANYWLRIAEDEVGKKPSSCRHDGRHLTAVRGIFGTVDVRGTLDAIGGTEFLGELERLDQQLFEADWANARDEHGDDVRVEHLVRSSPQRRADALVEMARRSRSTPADAQRPRPLITVLEGHGAFSRTCELANGTVISPGEVVPLLGEADIERIVFDGPSRVIDVGVRRRFFRGALRRAIEVRDRHCTHPSGCDVPAEGCDIDHIVPRSEGGLTVQENGRCLCGFHNRQRVGERHERPPPAAEDGIW